MKSLTRLVSRTLIGGLAGLVVASAWAQHEEHKPGIVLPASASELTHHLADIFNSRGGCAPAAPYETEFKLEGNPAYGELLTLTFNAAFFQFDGKATVEWDLPRGVRVVSTPQRGTGTLKAASAGSFQSQIVIDKPGTYVVSARVTGQTGPFTISSTRSFYFYGDQNGIQVQTQPRLSFDPTITEMGAPKKLQPSDPIAPANGLEKLPTPELDEREGTEGIGAHATTTITGTWRYRDHNGSLSAGYGTAVEAWDDNTFGDTFLGSVAVDGAGNYSLSFSNNETGLFESGTADVYLVFRTDNSESQTKIYGGGTYSTSTETVWLYNNIPGGTVSSGGWYADWGTAGVSDSTERAFQVLDYMTRTWAFVYNQGYDSHKTPIEWQAGKNDVWPNYTRGDDTVHISDYDYSSFSVISHEYGHGHMDTLYGEGDWPPGAGGSHAITGHYTHGLAISEGYATYICHGATGDKVYRWYHPTAGFTFDSEQNWDGYGSANGNSDNLSNGAGNYGYDTESAVQAFLLDLTDEANAPTDPYDWVDISHSTVMWLFKNHLPSGHHLYSMQDFMDGYASNGFAYQPKIWGQAMVHGMKQASPARPTLGVYSGVNTWSGTWYWGGYGRISGEIKNYGSQTFPMDSFWTWEHNPDGAYVYDGLTASDGDSSDLTSGSTRSIWNTTSHLNPSEVNRTGNYNVGLGAYSNGDWIWVQPAEAGTANSTIKAVVLDSDVPDYCTVTDDGYIQNNSTTLHYTATADDYDSGVMGYWVRVGTAPGAGDEMDWVYTARNWVTSYDETLAGLSMNANTTYYITVVARNFSGYDTFGYSDGIIAWDNTAPTKMSVLDDGLKTSVLDKLHFKAHGEENDGIIVAWWYQIYDEFNNSVRGWTRVVTGDIHDWEYTAAGLSLVNNRTYYVQVAAENNRPIYGYATTDGILTAQGKPLSGKIQPEDITNLAGRQAIIWIGANTIGGALWQGQYVTLDASGNYSMDAVYFGNVRVLAWFTKHLYQAKFVNINATTGLSNCNFKPINGDVDGDNVIGLFDYLRLSAAFDATPSDSNWDWYADLDEDGVVSLFDYLILSNNFDKEGDY